MDKMNGTLDDMQSELQIANKRLTRFAKSMFTDKLILLFVCLIVTVVVGIVVYSFMGGNDS